MPVQLTGLFGAINSAARDTWWLPARCGLRTAELWAGAATLLAAG